MSAWWSSAKVRYEQLLTEYGTLALGVYFTLFFGTWGGFWYALSAGFEVQGAAGQAGTFWGAYAATKLTQPLRIGATLVLTPLLAAARRRVWPSAALTAPGPQPGAPDAAGVADSEPAPPA